MCLPYSSPDKLSFKKFKKYDFIFAVALSRRQRRQNCTALFEYLLPVAACPHLPGLHTHLLQNTNRLDEQLNSNQSLFSVIPQKLRNRVLHYFYFRGNKKKIALALEKNSLKPFSKV